jgi:hypothetical protein
MDAYQKLAAAFGAGVLFSGAILVAAPFNALMGAVAGWTVEIFWGDTILRTLRSVGLPAGTTMWQLGATLGFVGSFLRTRTTVETK